MGQELPSRAYAPAAMTLSRAQSLALANSRDYKRVRAKIELQRVKYAAAVKSIQMKKKNMATFRWTPLLSFKFPEQPALADAFEWQYKPVQISSQITILQHQLTDTRCAVLEKTSLLYAQTYVCQEKISCLEEELKQKQKTLAKNKVRLAAGDASQADLDKLTQSIRKLTTELSQQLRSFETDKEKLTQMMKTDVTSGYVFENPFLEADLPRSALKELTEYTLENSQEYYEAKMNTALCRTGLEMNESLMRGQYGSKMDSIQFYINQAKSGQEIDGDAFKYQYDAFLKQIDEPWNGHIRILFIKINKEWFKGKISGSRYVEDDPYALYTSALDYEDAREEQISLEREITSSVRDGFEALVSAKNAYEDRKETNEELKTETDRALVKNMAGELSYPELLERQEEYEAGKLDELTLLSDYTSLLYSYDRLTCGGVGKYLSDGAFSMQGTSGGESYIEEEPVDGAYYYIETKIEDNIFVFGIQIPDDFAYTVTDYELKVNGVQIGPRTPADLQIRHLALDFDRVESAKVYLYDGEELMDVCEIDSSVSRAELQISPKYTVKQASERKVADFVCSADQGTGTAVLELKAKGGEAIAYYQIVDRSGAALGTREMLPIEEPLRYLSVVQNDLDRLKVLFYGQNKELLYEGRFNGADYGIYVEERVD